MESDQPTKSYHQTPHGDLVRRIHLLERENEALEARCRDLKTNMKCAAIVMILFVVIVIWFGLPLGTEGLR